MSRSDQPYPSREATTAAFAAHVDRGKTDVLRALGADIVVGAREGGRFADAFSGRWFWNCHCNGGVFNLGHRNPRVVRAVRDALDHLDVGNHHLISGWRAHLAEQLTATTGGALPYAVFGASGGEVVDLALKVAYGITGRSRIVSATGAFHGVVGFGRWAGDPRYDEPFSTKPPGFTQVPFNDLAALDRAIDDATAALVLESIPATLGFPIPDPGYLRAAGDLAHDRGALFILDEVQTGLGRTGTVWYYQQHEAQPDIVITGKGLGGGVYPIAAALMSADVHRILDEHPFVQVSTFGGAEIGCVAASTVLDIVTEPAFLERVQALGSRFASGFAELPFRLRRAGMTMGLAFDDPAGGLAASGALIAAGVFAVFADHDRAVTQFKPPLILTDEEADEIMGLVRTALT